MESKYVGQRNESEYREDKADGRWMSSVGLVPGHVEFAARRLGGGWREAVNLA